MPNNPDHTSLFRGNYFPEVHSRKDLRTHPIKIRAISTKRTAQARQVPYSTKKKLRLQETCARNQVLLQEDWTLIRANRYAYFIVTNIGRLQSVSSQSCNLHVNKIRPRYICGWFVIYTLVNTRPLVVGNSYIEPVANIVTTVYGRGSRSIVAKQPKNTQIPICET